jgi:hypothetical protein
MVYFTKKKGYERVGCFVTGFLIPNANPIGTGALKTLLQNNPMLQNNPPFCFFE